MFIRTFTALAAFFALFAAANAQQQQIIRFTSGTGFFVSKDGHIVTNAHVVRNCLAIDVHGAVQDKAQIIALDTDKDLAILKIPQYSPMVAPLRWNLESLREGQRVSVIGYPGQAGAQGQMRYNTSEIMGLEGPAG